MCILSDICVLLSLHHELLVFGCAESLVAFGHTDSLQLLSGQESTAFCLKINKRLHSFFVCP
jgi:hypothetical protein